MTFRRSRRVLLVVAVLVAGLLGPNPATPVAADGNEAPGAPLAFRSITSGGGFSCGRLGDGTVKCWGAGAALGQGDTMERGDHPDEMGTNLLPVALGTGRTATALTAGTSHACAVLDNGSVRCWGNNPGGQLGLGDTATRGDGPGEMGDNLPVVSLGTGRTATAITAGFEHTCALLDNATVKCWGRGGKLGLGDTETRGDGPGEMGDNLPAVDLGAGRTATAITAGFDHTCALLDNATVKCWGHNGFGQLGLGDNARRGDATGEMGDDLPAVNLGTGRTATAIVVGNNHTCALLDNATVKCWGQGSSGQLGLGDLANRGDAAGEMDDNLPAVSLGTGRTAVALTAGDAHTCALLDNAAMKCWGDNSNGQLGLGDTTTRGDNFGDNFGEMGDNLPAVDVGTGHSVTAMTTGSAHTCAIRNDNQLRCWGDNDNGQLGLGDAANRGDGAGEMGDNLPEVDLVGTGVGITGRVTSTATGNGVPAAWIAVMSAADFSLVRRLFTNGNGDYAAELPAGNYHLFVLPLGANLIPGFHGAPTTVPVTTGLTVANPTLASHPAPGTISGRIRATDTNSNTVVRAWVIAINSTGALEKATTANDDGHYSLSLRPGTYYLVAVDRAGFHDSRFHPSTSMLPGSTPVVVTSNNNTTANITLPGRSPGTQSATITGQVTSGSGNLGGIWVIALRASDFTMVRGAITNSTGNYTLDVPPDNYHVGFIDPTVQRPMEWWNDQPANNLAGATTITAPQTAINPVLPLSTGAIAGTVRRGATGWANVWAIALGPTGVAGMALSCPCGPPLVGNYVISGLTPGNYRMMYIDPAGGAEMEFYEDQADYNSATPLAVTANTTILNINPDINSPQ